MDLRTCGSSAYSGAVSLWFLPLATLSNCAFVSCTSTSKGGALGLTSVTLIDFSFLQFRGCSSDSNSKDIFFDGMSASLVTEDTVKSCDSTSGLHNVYVYTGTVDKSGLVPQLSSTPTVTVSVSISGETATVTATASPAVKGTIGILLNGTNVPRLVHVQFGSGSGASSTGTVVSSGANGVLPQATYKHHSSSVATGYFLPTSLHSAHSSLKDGNTTEIVLKGINFGEGSYWMLVRNGGNTFNISLTRSDSTTLVGSAPLHPSTTEGRLEWSTEYEVETMMLQQQPGGIEENVHLTNKITFTTPSEPSRLLSLKSKSLNGKKDEITISLVGSSLPDGTGTIEVKQTGSDVVVKGVLTKVTATECRGVISTAWAEDATHVSFGKTYSSKITRRG
ncbi:hypothetical protein BLNAU_19518 [Blattamonas nauphoetae]|uniref:Uncharacterized protein n=1 Tax=Blattamonas nauphoetae TaxID=2049346 RepID=A0ABQ9X1A9_9EUKA|nr:hypothetical protein BLNAU_19518 [Blattamonas nauphoetae]